MSKIITGAAAAILLASAGTAFAQTAPRYQGYYNTAPYTSPYSGYDMGPGSTAGRLTFTPWGDPSSPSVPVGHGR